MLNTLIKKIFGSRNDRTLARMEKTVLAINALEPAMQALSDHDLENKTSEFKTRIAQGETLESLLPEAFAVVREVAVRQMGMRHFDVQLIGGMVLHEGNIAEMRTGEGKTLTSTLPAYLNALSGDGVHVVTVNDYLAKRDSQWNLPIFKALGITVGVIFPDMPREDKQNAYTADIVYGTNNEFGFDYLRDNMVFEPAGRVQKKLNFAIVDEVDSILIDEARTPLIISGAAEDSSDLYLKINDLILQLDPPSDGAEGDYTLDEKQKQAHLTEKGHQHIEALLAKKGLITGGESLYHASNIMLMHHVNAALRAHKMFAKDVDYIIADDKVVIVDEHTGRTMPGRRWSEGLHQAIEAKEKVSIQNENQTLASITFQNYFRIYSKLSGMTGTADTEAYEFQQIYNLDVVVIPTNKSMIRSDQADLIYMGQQDKFQAIIEDVRDCVLRKQPVLVGTASIESSELLSHLLTKEKIKHQVLNAKFHEKEAQIIAEAGRPGAVTIATNMAGRGTDIVLGGNLAAELAQLPPDATAADKQAVKVDWQDRHAKVIATGGLRIIGSERHESRRIDNQLRGRAGRQGDPGSTRFYLSLEDTLMRIFASERVSAMMRRLGMKPGEPIEHSLITRAIENAQRKLEGHHFDVRKQLLDYDNVANEQRKIIYSQRAILMSMDDLSDFLNNIRESVFNSLVDTYVPPTTIEDQWDADTLEKVLADEFKIDCPVKQWIDADHHIQPETIKAKILAIASANYALKEQKAGPDSLRAFEKSIILQTMDLQWREHLATMDHLRQGIHLRGYAQKDPKQEYKKEAFTLFTMMLDNLKYDIVRLLSSVVIQSQEDAAAMEELRRNDQIMTMQFNHDSLADEQDKPARGTNVRRIPKKVGRNENCPCGSGKKFKVCHGSLS